MSHSDAPLRYRHLLHSEGTQSCFKPVDTTAQRSTFVTLPAAAAISKPIALGCTAPSLFSQRQSSTYQAESSIVRVFAVEIRVGSYHVYPWYISVGVVALC